ncbi:MAG: hypothetical protein ACREBU_16680, partial [Nitrososphaera sp.]
MNKKLILFAVSILAFPTLSPTVILQTELSYDPKSAKGIHGIASYLGGVGEINLVNGNLVFGRQLVSRPGRAGFDVNLSLIYNSKLWSRFGSEMRITELGSWVGLGWRLEFPKLKQGSLSYALIASDGAAHEIADYGAGVWKSVDSTYIRLDPVTKIATLKGGVKLMFGNTVGSMSYLTEMKDRNGNKITVSYLAGTGKISQVQDTLGTAALFFYNGDGQLERIRSLGKIHTNIEFTYATASLSPTFSIPSQLPAGEKRLSEITIKLPMKDLKQVYVYNNFGELTDFWITLIEYGYDEFWNLVELRRSTKRPVTYYYSTLNFYDATYGSVEERAVTTKTDYVEDTSGTSNRTTSIAYQVDQTKSNPWKVTTTEGTFSGVTGLSEYDFYCTVNGRNWSDGLLQAVRRKASATGPTLRTQTTTWTQDDTGVSYIVNPRVTSQTTTLDNGLSTRVDTTYTTDGTGNVREIIENGFSGSALRWTVTNYLHETNSVYTGLNMTDLVSSTSVRNGVGVEVS